MKSLLFAALAASLSAGPAFAQEGGELTAALGGQTYAFPLWASQSDWSGAASYASVNIYTRPTDPETSALYRQLTLGFEVAGGAASSAELSLTRVAADGSTEKLYGEDDAGDVTVSVTAISVDGDYLTLEGSFQGMIGPSDNFGRDIDLSDPIPVSGSISVVLGPVQ